MQVINVSMAKQEIGKINRLKYFCQWSVQNQQWKSSRGVNIRPFITINQVIAF